MRRLEQSPKEAKRITTTCGTYCPIIRQVMTKLTFGRGRFDFAHTSATGCRLRLTSCCGVATTSTNELAFPEPWKYQMLGGLDSDMPDIHKMMTSSLLRLISCVYRCLCFSLQGKACEYARFGSWRGKMVGLHQHDLVYGRGKMGFHGRRATRTPFRVKVKVRFGR